MRMSETRANAHTQRKDGTKLLILNYSSIDQNSC